MIRFFLAPFSILYWIGLRVDRFVRTRRRRRLSRPVISIGNLTWGGTGKTPLTIKIAEDLLKSGFRPAILTRGYRGVGRRPAPKIIASKPSERIPEPSEIGDEPNLFLRRLPGIVVGVGADRAANAQRILSGQPVDVFLLDDGFQHWPLHRDFDVVVIDATDPWGGGHLLPWGRLREPVRALDRARAVVITRSELVDTGTLDAIKSEIRRRTRASIHLARQTLSLCDESGAEVPWPEHRPWNVVAVSAIGNPAAFEEGLRRKGASVFPLRFVDHHEYSLADVETAAATAKKHSAMIVTTEKDHVKWKHVSMKVSGQDVVTRVARITTGFDPSGELDFGDVLAGKRGANVR